MSGARINFSPSNPAGFDSSLHISEEAENARVAVPRGLVGATVVAGIMGWGELSNIDTLGHILPYKPLAINVVLAFRMGTDVESIMNSPIGQPMAVVREPSLIIRGCRAEASIPDFV